jgi:hypothetical protein
MKLTIVRSDGLVIKNGKAYGDLDMSSIDPSIHAVQWDDASGQIEFVVGSDGIKPVNKPITSIDEFQAVIDEWDAKDYATNHPPAPSPKHLLIACVARAKMLLKDTDWSQLPDVQESLLNKNEFDAYRETVRSYVITPVESPVFPDCPKAIWAS